MSRRWLLLILLLLPFSAAASSVQATLDRTQVHLGETVTLNLRINDAMSASTPDLSALNKDFEVLGTSANSSLSIMNGRQSAQVVIGIALRPKHVGDLPIPPLDVAGSQTAPLTLHVLPPDNSAAAEGGKSVFVETTAQPDHGYVGQQLLYTVRLFYSVNLNSGTLPDPQADGADLRRLGKDIDYDAMRNGRRYHVVERQYALIPRHAGTLTIPSIEFQGEAVDPGNPADPGQFFGPNGLFGDTTPVSADSSPVAIPVQAPPADWGKTAWLPARVVSLGLEGWPADGKASVGQPINLHMSVHAEGLPADALPEPSLPSIDGAKVYPDQATNSTHDDGTWLAGQRERAFAIIPQHAGPLVIPAVALTWFDVQSGQKRVATIPAHTLTVLPAANVASATPSAPASTGATPAAPATVAAAGDAAMPAPPASSTPWRWIALASIALWLVSMVAFVWQRRRRRAPTGPVVPSMHDSVRSMHRAFLDTATAGSAATQAHALLAWARAERPGLQNLGQLAAALASERQRAAIEHLQRRQYAHASAGDASDLIAAFSSGFDWSSEREPVDSSPLPPLYPFTFE